MTRGRRLLALIGLVIWTVAAAAIGGWLVSRQAPPPQHPASTRPLSGVVSSGATAVASFAETMTFNAAAGNSIKLTLLGDVTDSSIANATPGQFLTLLLCQDEVGAHNMTWPENLKLSAGGFPLTPDPGRCDALTIVYDGFEWYEIARSRND